MKKNKLNFLSIFLMATAVSAQQPPPEGHGPGGGQGMPGMRQGPPSGMYGRPMSRVMHGGPSGKWWTDPATVQRIGLTPDQESRIDGIFQASRLSLIDLSAALQKEEAILEPLLEAEHPDEPRVLLQIDRIAQARAGLEKANARMLLGFRGVLTQDQWKKLQAEGPHPPGGFPRR